MRSKIEIILYFVSEYIKIMELLIRSEVLGNEIVLYKKRKRVLKEKIRFCLNQQWIILRMEHEMCGLW